MYIYGGGKSGDLWRGAQIEIYQLTEELFITNVIKSQRMRCLEHVTW